MKKKRKVKALRGEKLQPCFMHFQLLGKCGLILWSILLHPRK